MWGEEECGVQTSAGGRDPERAGEAGRKGTLKCRGGWAERLRRAVLNVTVTENGITCLIICSGPTTGAEETVGKRRCLEDHFSGLRSY